MNEAMRPVVQPVAVVDLDMPIGSMARLMIKWAVAAVPALLFLGIVGLFLVAVLSAMFR
jgi:hypothetical protein